MNSVAMVERVSSLVRVVRSTFVPLGLALLVGSCSGSATDGVGDLDEPTSDTSPSTTVSPDEACTDALMGVMVSYLNQSPGNQSALVLTDAVGGNSPLFGEMARLAAEVQLSRAEDGLATSQDLLRTRTVELCVRADFQEAFPGDGSLVGPVGEEGSDENACWVKLASAFQLTVLEFQLRGGPGTYISDMVGTGSSLYRDLFQVAVDATAIAAGSGRSESDDFIRTTANELCADPELQAAVLGLT